MRRAGTITRSFCDDGLLFGYFPDAARPGHGCRQDGRDRGQHAGRSSWRRESPDNARPDQMLVEQEVFHLD